MAYKALGEHQLGWRALLSRTSMQGYARGTGECQRHEDPRMQRGGSVGGVCSENDWCMPTGVSVALVGGKFC